MLEKNLILAGRSVEQNYRAKLYNLEILKVKKVVFYLTLGDARRPKCSSPLNARKFGIRVITTRFKYIS